MCYVKRFLSLICLWVCFPCFNESLMFVGYEFLRVLLKFLVTGVFRVFMCVM